MIIKAQKTKLTRSFGCMLPVINLHRIYLSMGFKYFQSYCVLPCACGFCAGFFSLIFRFQIHILCYAEPIEQYPNYKGTDLCDMRPYKRLGDVYHSFYDASTFILRYLLLLWALDIPRQRGLRFLLETQTRESRATYNASYRAHKQ